jgi:hypothetical protein
MKLKYLILLPVILISGINQLNGAKTETAVHRFAFIAGANNGGPGRPLLKYAVSDAYSFFNVMKSLGGVSQEKSILLVEPDSKSFLRALDNAEKILIQDRAKYKRVEMIFYYSGHSDEQGILLGREKISYIELRKRIEKMQADVKIAILDSCSSGAFTRIKGGIMRSPFLVDSANDMKGYAFMTSSSSDEASQESDRIQGSFFTHYLITGLRGAADMSRDGRITLNEAYQFAYNETLSRTEKSMAGAQHPNYNIKMTGTGDVIMTDIRKSNTALVLNRNLSGKFYIHDSDNILVAELNKPFGIETELGLGSGKYRVVNDNLGAVSESEIDLSGTSRTMLAQNDMKSSDKEKTAIRGDSKAAEKTDEKENLSAKNKFEPGGYGAVTLKISQIGNTGTDTAGYFIGLRTGFIMNHNFSLGLGINILFNPVDREKLGGVPYTGPDSVITMGYGGLLLEYFIMSKKLVTISIGLLIGGGGMVFQDGNYWKNQTFNPQTVNGFFAIEPEVNVFFNITKFFRIGVGGTYRYVNGIKDPHFTDKGFSGFGGQITVQFGWF